MGEVTDWVAGALGASRAVLIPYGGTLAQLPWHAAWTADANVPEPVPEYRRRYVCDQVAWRYGPSARLLGDPRRYAARRAAAAEAVIVHHAKGPTCSAAEAAAVRAALGAGTELTGRRARPETVPGCVGQGSLCPSDRAPPCRQRRSAEDASGAGRHDRTACQRHPATAPPDAGGWRPWRRAMPP